MCRRFRATLIHDQLGTASGLETLTGNAAINTSETVPTVARRVCELNSNWRACIKMILARHYVGLDGQSHHSPQDMVTVIAIPFAASS
jgi:hypothetical protein